MKFKHTHSLLTLLALGFPFLCAAQEPVDADSADNDEIAKRLAPTIEGTEDSGTQIAIDYSKWPSYINREANHIELNGNDWGILAEALKEARYGFPVSILHIGDSHIQADGATGVTRRLMQRDYGDAGRGLITPLRLAGTNEPRDYTFTSNSRYTSNILVKRPWNNEMGSTGCMLTPAGSEFTFTVSTRTKNFAATPFSVVRIIYGGADPRVVNVTSDGEKLQATTQAPMAGDKGYFDVVLAKPVTSATITLGFKGQTYIYGADLMRGAADTAPGVFYHIIGNNGATYGSYNRVKSLGDGLRGLMPDLIIVSMGANEAFGKISDSEFYKSIDKFVNEVKKANPAADMLLVTPMECLRNGVVNTNVKRLRNVILKYGRENGIPTYDFYEVASGDGAAGRWRSNNLLSKDGVHNTWDGYTIQGELMYEALKDALR